MTRKELTIDYIEYASIEELIAEDRLVVEAAIDAMKGSYAPYSNFNVGAAVLLEDGSIGNGNHAPEDSWAEEFLDKTYCMLSYSASSATLLCWSHDDVSNDMLRLCETYGLDISVMPDTRYGNVYDVVWKFR